MIMLKQRRNPQPGTTLVELAVAISLMAIVMACVLPLISSTRNSFDSAHGNMEAVQNGRALTQHILRNLGQAIRITDVSPDSQTLGYIEFANKDGDILRYDVDPNGYVDFGLVASQTNLAGPVSQLLFTCYDQNDFATPITDPNYIRFVKVQTTVVNGALMGQDKTFSTSAYLMANYQEAAYEFDTLKGKTPDLAQIDSTHYLCAYQGDDDNGWATVLYVNPGLWSLSKGTAFEFNTYTGKTPALAQADATHYLCAYEGGSEDGWATILNVNTSNWTLSQSTAHEFDVARGKTPALAQIDSNQYLCVYEGPSDDGWAQILTVDTDTWQVTSASDFEFDTVKGRTPALAQIDDEHYLCAYTGNDDDAWAVVLTVAADNGLIGHWMLDETSGTTAADSSGNGNNGTLTNMAGNEWTSGQVAGALQFDGSNDYVAIPHIDAYLADNGTVALWFKGDNVSGRGELFSKDSSNYDTGGHLTIYVNDDEVEVRLQGTSTSDEVNSGEILDDDTWYHAALTWGSTGMTLYINGVEVDTDSYTGGLGTSSGGAGNYEPLALGACTWGSNNLAITPLQYYFEGAIDDVRFYGRALDATEVETLASILRYEGFSEAKTGTDTTSLTVSPPANTSAGDLLIAAAATDGDTAASLAPPGGQGWTQIDLNDYGNEVTLGAWWKTAGASEPTHQFTWTGSEQAYIGMMRFAGHHATGPIDVFSTSNTTSGSPGSPSVTTTVDGTFVLRLGGFDDNDITQDVPGLSGHTAITMDTNAGSGQVSFQALTETKLASKDEAVTLDTPSGTNPGDLLIAAVVTDGDKDGSMAPPGGQGWTEIYAGDEGDRVSLGVWWKTAGASEPSTHTFTWSGDEESYAWMMRFTGHDPSSPIHDWDKRDSSSSSPDCDAVTTTVANCLILRIGGFDDGDINEDLTGLEGHTNITMDESSSSYGECSGGAGYEQQATLGDSSEPDFNLTGYEQYVTLSVAIAPGAGGGGTGSVSGGAGYVKQVSAGSSGTSTFSLTASEQARLVTLAIAPKAQTEPSPVTTIAKGTAFEFDTSKGKTPALAQIDATHYLCAYTGNDDDGYAVVLTVNTSSWTITKGTRLEFDTSKGLSPTLSQIDTSHYFCAYTGRDDDGWATILNVNTSNWTISKGNTFEYDAEKGLTPALVRINNDHHLCAYSGKDDDGYAAVLDPNSSGLGL
jgi:type II secretory pathway pseudopilin PulG